MIFRYCGDGNKGHQCRYCASYRDMRYYGIFGDIYVGCNSCQHPELRSDHEKKWFGCGYVFYIRQFPGHGEFHEASRHELLFGQF